MNIEKVLLVVTLLGVLCSLSAYSLLAYQIMVSPTTIYSMSFKGNADNSASERAQVEI
ncbi:MAG: hypothetical protein ABSA11_15580 [Candidatus Bathyarchaeia archaeon]